MGFPKESDFLHGGRVGPRRHRYLVPPYRFGREKGVDVEEKRWSLYDCEGGGSPKSETPAAVMGAQGGCKGDDRQFSRLNECFWRWCPAWLQKLACVSSFECAGAGHCRLLQRVVWSGLGRFWLLVNWCGVGGWCACFALVPSDRPGDWRECDRSRGLRAMRGCGTASYAGDVVVDVRGLV